MLSDIFSLDRRLALANERLRLSSPSYPEIDGVIDTLLSAYAIHHKLSAPAIVAAYDNFSRLFADHLKHFQQHRQYPLEHSTPPAIDRITYDLSLLLSCVVNSARFRITEKLIGCLRQQTHTKDFIVVGCGAGIELEIIRRTGCDHRVIAYDMDLGDFVRQRFANFSLRAETFDHSCLANNVDIVLAIEILEHIEDPLALLDTVRLALKPGGICYCTTATDLPQFDHRYNFTDIPLFQRQLQSQGFNILETHTFTQPYPFLGMESRNDWFTLQKNPSA